MPTHIPKSNSKSFQNWKRKINSEIKEEFPLFPRWNFIYSYHDTNRYYDHLREYREKMLGLHGQLSDVEKYERAALQLEVLRYPFRSERKMRPPSRPWSLPMIHLLSFILYSPKTYQGQQFHEDIHHCLSHANNAFHVLPSPVERCLSSSKRGGKRVRSWKWCSILVYVISGVQTLLWMHACERLFRCQNAHLALRGRLHFLHRWVKAHPRCQVSSVTILLLWSPAILPSISREVSDELVEVKKFECLRWNCSP